MLKFVSKALKSLLLEDKTGDRKAAATVQAERPRPEIPRERPPGSPPPDELSLKVKAPRKMTPERRELIDKALKVQRSKTGILKDLSFEDREKLHLMASEMFLGKRPAKNKK